MKSKETVSRLCIFENYFSLRIVSNVTMINYKGKSYESDKNYKFTMIDLLVFVGN